MIPANVSKLGPKVWKIDIKAQKINISLLKIVEMVIPSFSVIDKLGKAKYF